MVLGTIVLVIVGILVVNYFKDKENSAITDNSTQVSVVNEHVVTEGETLWSIAEDSYGSGYNWVDIKEVNSLESDDVEVGQKLIIPNDITLSEPTTTQTEAQISEIEELVSNQSTVEGDTYTVEKGDCLWDIAVRAYGDGYKWTEIAQANDLENPNLIHSGNVLMLPR